jgi:hypothetical protein
MMKNSIASKTNQRNSLNKAKSIDIKKIVRLATTTFLMLVLVSEALKLASQAW